MPYIESSQYHPDGYWRKNAHLSTIIPAKFKNYPIPNYEREKWELDDGDFLLLDWHKQNNKKKILIICHGLEGNSRRNYANTSSDYFFAEGYNILAWNQRSCGGEMNRNYRLYHHGITDDLERIVNRLVAEKYEEIYMIGFSLGGAVILNYASQNKLPSQIKALSSISAPLVLKASVSSLNKFPNTVYRQNFIKDLVPKLKAKAAQFPGKLPVEKLKEVKDFSIIDDFFTAPLHGFKDKDDYYESVSPLHKLDHIKVPTLLLNALNDPFIDNSCYPIEKAKNWNNVYFEAPEFGGHCGFPVKNSHFSWSEIRTAEFFESLNPSQQKISQTKSLV